MSEKTKRTRKSLRTVYYNTEESRRAWDLRGRAFLRKAGVAFELAHYGASSDRLCLLPSADEDAVVEHVVQACVPRHENKAAFYSRLGLDAESPKLSLMAKAVALAVKATLQGDPEASKRIAAASVAVAFEDEDRPRKLR